MRSLDTNVLVRYLAADEPQQSAAAERFIETCLREGEQLYLTAIVLCELVWVLRRIYRQTKSQIAEHLEQILRTAQFTIEKDSIVRRSLRAWKLGKGDFSDHLIGELARLAGCRDTATFDRDLRNLPGFTLLQ